MNNDSESTPRHTQSRSEQIMARARARIELEKTGDDATDLLTFEEPKPQYGIRHAIVFTTLTAVVIALYQEGGIGNAFAGILVSIITWFVFYVYEQELKKESDAEQRLQQTDGRRSRRERHLETAKSTFPR